MKMCRIVALILLACIVVNCSSCSRSMAPDLQLVFKKRFEADTVDQAVPFGSKGIVVSLNTDELLIMDKDGNELWRQQFNAEITSIYSGSDDRIVISLNNNEVQTYMYDNDIFVLEYDFYFDDAVSDVSYLDYPYDTSLVLLDNGDLYAYGGNHNNIISEESDEDDVIDEPTNILSDIKYISEFYFVTSNDSCGDLLIGELNDSVPDGVIGVSNYTSGPILYTSDTAYTISSTQTDYSVVSDFAPNSFTSFKYGMLYSHDDTWYYTGPISAQPKGKSSPQADNEQVNLPEGYTYQIIYSGIMGYDEHTIVCYSI
ncbi:hypothetical protein SAMN06296952_0872 [Oscillospiraceae bacterium]|nr:hypothetical protein SAMN06296952_0872 [Oscillospiraceae bacterium]